MMERDHCSLERSWTLYGESFLNEDLHSYSTFQCSSTKNPSTKPFDLGPQLESSQSHQRPPSVANASLSVRVSIEMVDQNQQSYQRRRVASYVANFLLNKQ